MDGKITRFGTQHLPPTSLLRVLMQSTTSSSLGFANYKSHEARRDHILRPSLFLEL